MKSEPQQNGAKRGNEHLVVYRQTGSGKRRILPVWGCSPYALGKGRWHMGLHELADLQWNHGWGSGSGWPSAARANGFCHTRTLGGVGAMVRSPRASYI